MIRQKIIRRKGSHGRILFLLECGHVRAMPSYSPKNWQPGKLLRCKDCEELQQKATAQFESREWR